jgi:hypothetical protein
MTYQLKLKVEAFHKPTETWHVHGRQVTVRAVSRKHALDKGLKQVRSWPPYQDRAGHMDWQVSACAEFANE